MVQHSRSMWGMPQVAHAFEWLETLFSLIAGPMIIVSGLAAPFALFTRIQVLEQPALLAVYAIAMAAGIDIWLLIAADRFMHTLMRQNLRQLWPLLCVWALLMLALAGVGFQANWIVTYASSQGISNDAAMAQIGISPMLWALERAALVPFLVIVSTLIRRYVVAQGAQQQAASTPPVIVDGGPVEVSETLQEPPSNVRSITAGPRTVENRSHSGRPARGYVNDPRYQIAAASWWRDAESPSISKLAHHLGVSQGTADKLHAKVEALGERVWDLYDEIPQQEGRQA